ncbi:HMA2 domain-containing protein [Methylomarinum vadi]|uniref:HMA2 domain-containing protein n=1 Tax=Methylomarinum vadi TaxID=438855 RepID=UPI0004DF5608|nr:hypothetical protein [Methylomarinum vadi]
MSAPDSIPSAFVKHQLPGRVRLKIPEKKGDFRYFDRVADVFAGSQGITQLQLNPPAASVLISHRDDISFQHIVEFAENNGLFRLTEKPEDYEPLTLPNLPIATLSSIGLDRVDDSLLNLSKNRLDNRSVLFLTLIGLAIHQIARGNIMAPAASLLWYALELLEKENEISFEIEKQHESDQ